MTKLAEFHKESTSFLAGSGGGGVSSFLLNSSKNCEIPGKGIL